MGGTGGCAPRTGGGLALTWLGHSSVLVEVAGARVLADPVLRQRVGALRRAVPAAATARAVQGIVDDPVDVVLISHLHHDHCDLPTLRRLRPGLLVVPPGARQWLGRHGFDAVELAPGCELEVADGVHVTAVPAEHLGRREPWGPTASAVGHLVESPTATAWLAGDTGLFAGMAHLADLGRRGVVDLAAVPVWGWGPNLGAGHLDPERAAEAVGAVGARAAVPVHWGTYHPAGLSFTMRHQLRTPGGRFAAAVAARGAPVRAEVLAVGATTRLPAAGSSR